MTGCPQRSCNSLPMSRPEMSSGPPGGNGTTRRIGLEGKSCAVALAASVSPHTRTAVVRLIVPPRREPISPSPPGESASRRGYNSSSRSARMNEVAIQPGAVTAGLHYTVDTGVKPVNETFGPNNIRRRVSGEHEVRQVTIRNGRPLVEEFDLEVTGFEFVEHRTRVRDFFDLD